MNSYALNCQYALRLTIKIYYHIILKEKNKKNIVTVSHILVSPGVMGIFEITKALQQLMLAKHR